MGYFDDIVGPNRTPGGTPGRRHLGLFDDIVARRDSPARPTAPESPGIGSTLLRGAQGILNLGGAGAGAIAGAFTGGWGPDSAYSRSLQENADAQGVPGNVFESARIAPGPGQVIAEAIAPGRPQTATGRVAKNVGTLVGDIAGDPANLVGGGIAGAAKAFRGANLALRSARAGRHSHAAARAIEGTARAYGSATAALAYAPEIVTGTVEAGKQAYEAARAGNVSQAAEMGSQALLTGGLGGLALHGVRSEAQGLYRRNQGIADAIERQKREQARKPFQSIADAAAEAPDPSGFPDVSPRDATYGGPLEISALDDVYQGRPVPEVPFDPPIPREEVAFRPDLEARADQQQARLMRDELETRRLEDIYRQGQPADLSPRLAAREPALEPPPPVPEPVVNRPTPVLEPVVNRGNPALEPARAAEPGPEPPIPVEQRVGDRRVADLPVEVDQRVADRRAAIRQEFGEIPDPVVDRLIQAEDRATALETEANTDPLTGLGNRRAMEADTPKAVAAFDAEGLKWINDNIGHEAGDEMLRTIGRVISGEPGVRGFRSGGDEFFLHADTPEAAEAAALNIQRELARAEIVAHTPDGGRRTFTGARADFGIGESREKADTDLYAKRDAASARGERTPRGERPRSLVEVPPEGKPAGDQAPAPPEGLDLQGRQFSVDGRKYRVANQDDTYVVLERLDGDRRELMRMSRDGFQRSLERGSITADEPQTKYSTRKPGDAFAIGREVVEGRRSQAAAEDYDTELLRRFISGDFSAHDETPLIFRDPARQAEYERVYERARDETPDRFERQQEEDIDPLSADVVRDLRQLDPIEGLTEDESLAVRLFDPDLRFQEPEAYPYPDMGKRHGALDTIVEEFDARDPETWPTRNLDDPGDVREGAAADELMERAVRVQDSIEHSSGARREQMRAEFKRLQAEAVSLRDRARKEMRDIEKELRAYQKGLRSKAKRMMGLQEKAAKEATLPLERRRAQEDRAAERFEARALEGKATGEEARERRAAREQRRREGLAFSTESRERRLQEQAFRDLARQEYRDRFPESASADTAPKPAIDDTVVSREFKGAQKVGDSEWLVPTRNGRALRVRVTDQGALDLNAADLKSQIDKGLRTAGEQGEQIVGAYQRFDAEDLITVSKSQGTTSTLRHEKWHAVKQLARDAGIIGERDIAALRNRYEAEARKKYEAQGKKWSQLSENKKLNQIEEIEADAYGAWNPKAKSHSVFQRILDFFRRIYRTFRPDAETVFERLPGKVLGVDQKGRVDSAVKAPREAFATAAKAVGDKVENFRRWFGDSKVVDEKGAPLRVYHGTNQSFEAFDLGRSQTEDGIFFTDMPYLAGVYAESRKRVRQFREGRGRITAHGANLIPAYLKLENPLIREMKGYDKGKFDNIIAIARQRGHDGVIIQNVVDTLYGEDFPSNVYIAFEPTQIKSVFNRGTFDPKDPRISYAAEVPRKGAGDRPPEQAPRTPEGGEYRGEHGAPERDTGSPAHDLQARETYPEDIYGPNGRRYYGDGDDALDAQSMAVIRSLRGKPNAKVRIYRAIPDEPTPQDLISRYESQKAYILKHGRLPPKAARPEMDSNAYYDWIHSEIERLRDAPASSGIEATINPGDWVTINRAYAKGHGEGALRGEYRIVSKQVRARDIYTNGDSIHEWGYDPDRPAPPQRGATRYSTAPAEPPLFDSPSSRSGKADRQPPEAKPGPRPVELAKDGVPRPTEQNPVGRALPDETRAEAFIRNVQNKFNRIGKLQKHIKEGGGKLSESSDVVAHEELFPGRTETRLGDFEDKYQNPIIKGIADSKLTVQEVDDYLYAKHAPARNERMKKINETDEDGLSGMTDDEARKILADFDAAGKTEKLEAVAKQVRESLKFQRDLLRESGLVSPEEIASWEKAFGPDYVPLKTLEVEDLPLRTGQGFDIRGRETKSATGRRSKADSPLAFAMAQAQQAIVRAEKNRVGQSFLQLVRDNPDEALWKLHEKVPTTKALGADGKVHDVVDFSFKNRDDVLVVKEGGKEYAVEIRDPLVARAMKNLGANSSGKLVQWLGSANRWYSALVTSYSPEFILTNPARDIQAAVANISADHSAKVAKGMVKNTPKAIRALYAKARGKAGSGEWDKLAKEFQEDGGQVGFYGLKGVEDQLADLHKKVSRAGGEKDAGKAIRAIGRWVEDANKAMENGVRLSAYSELRKAGISRQKAASAAKNLTVNFNRKGELGTSVNALYAFSNASIQGTARLAQMLRTKRGAKIATGVIAAGYVLDQYNRAAAGDENKDGTNDYDAIPDYVKERNWVLMRGEGKKPLMFPMPYGFNVLHHAGQMTSAMLSGAKKPTEAAMGLWTAAASAFNPVGGEADVVQQAAPTLLDPVVQIAMNRNFAGNPLKPEPFPGSEKPESELYFSTVSPTSQKIARRLNQLTGGDEVTSGWADVSPEVLDHVVQFVTGGLGRFAGQAVDLGGYAAKGETPPIRKTPFARRFIYEPHPSETVIRYRENKEELDHLQKRQKFYRENRMSTELRGLPQRMLRAADTVDRIDRQITSFRKRGLKNDDPHIQRLQLQALRVTAEARARSH